jgi:hypothetical protein
MKKNKLAREYFVFFEKNHFLKSYYMLL